MLLCALFLSALVGCADAKEPATLVKDKRLFCSFQPDLGNGWHQPGGYQDMQMPRCSSKTNRGRKTPTASIASDICRHSDLKFSEKARLPTQCVDRRLRPKISAESRCGYQSMSSQRLTLHPSSGLVTSIQSKGGPVIHFKHMPIRASSVCICRQSRRTPP